MRKILIFLMIILGFGSGTSQVPIDPSDNKEFALNMTGLVSNFIPFNSTHLGLQRYSFAYKYTRIKKKSGKLATLRVALGVDNLLDGTENFNFNFRIGREKKKRISDKWTFIHGNEFILAVEPIEDADDFFDDLPRIGVGYAHPFGIEFHLNNRISIYTETAIELTIGFPPIALRVTPPASLFLNVRI